MTIAKLIEEYLRILVWPLIALTALLLYRKILASLVPGAKVKLTFSGFAIETTLPVIERSVTESLGGHSLTPEQLLLLRRLKSGSVELDTAGDMLKLARPLRNAGLIRHHPEEGFLQVAKIIELTTLGRLLVEAAG
jgi:hypothetical protein